MPENPEPKQVAINLQSILREEQRPRYHELVQAFRGSNVVLLTGGLGTGKSFMGLTYALTNLPAVFVCSSYRAVDELLASITRFFSPLASNLLIVKPEGRQKACRTPGCRHSSIWNSARPGKIMTKEEVPPEYCAYASLLATCERADLVITHHSVLKVGLLQLRPGATLVVDECEEFLKAHDYLLLRYTGGKSTHLGIEFDNIGKVISALQYLLRKPPLADPNKRIAFQERTADTLKILTGAYDSLADIAKLEAQSVVQGTSLIDAEEVSDRILAADKQIQLTVESLNRSKSISRLRSLINSFAVSDFRGLPADLRQNIMDFWNVGHNLKQFYFRGRFPSPTSVRGYREVKIGDETGDIKGRFKRTLLISATPPTSLPVETPRVSIEDPSTFKKVLFVLFPETSKVRRLVQRLMLQYNILGITTGKQRTQMRMQRLGGKSVEEIGDLTEFNKDLLSRKGILLWNYYHSSFSNSVNSLHAFDGALVMDWISRDIAQVEEDIGVQRSVSFNNLVQILGRVLRPDPSGLFRSRFVIVVDRQTYNLLRKRYKGAHFLTKSEAEQAFDAIQKFTEPFPIRDRFRITREIKTSSQSAGRKPRTGTYYTQKFLKVSVPSNFPEGRYRVTAELVE